MSNIVPKSPMQLVDPQAQIIVDFLTHHFGSQTQSYNIFFYDLGSRIAVKLLPRFATPPIFVGYGIHFRPSSLEEAIRAIQSRYFPAEA